MDFLVKISRSCWRNSLTAYFISPPELNRFPFSDCFNGLYTWNSPYGKVRLWRGCKCKIILITKLKLYAQNYLMNSDNIHWHRITNAYKQEVWKPTLPCFSSPHASRSSKSWFVMVTYLWRASSSKCSHIICRCRRVRGYKVITSKYLNSLIAHSAAPLKALPAEPKWWWWFS